MLVHHAREGIIGLILLYCIPLKRAARLLHAISAAAVFPFAVEYYFHPQIACLRAEIFHTKARRLVAIFVKLAVLHFHSFIPILPFQLHSLCRVVFFLIL